MSLSGDALDAALEKVSYIFPSSSTQDTLTQQQQGFKFAAKGIGRNRVDSQARPPEFARNVVKEAHRAVNYQEFSVHGIDEPVLRHRYETKVVDVQTMNRVLNELQQHDKLPAEELEKLRGLADKALQLHKVKDDSAAEKLFHEVMLRFNDGMKSNLFSSFERFLQPILFILIL